jgi:hypothetical protein
VEPDHLAGRGEDLWAAGIVAVPERRKEDIAVAVIRLFEVNRDAVTV